MSADLLPSPAQRAQNAVLAFRATAPTTTDPEKIPSPVSSKNNITVCVRKRPMNASERANVGITTDSGCDRRDTHEFECVSVLSNSSTIFHHVMENSSFAPTSGGIQNKKYVYHHVFAEDDDAQNETNPIESCPESDHPPAFDHPPVSHNDLIYSQVVADLIPFARDQGGVGTVIAYGQTGSGKTYTQIAMQDRIVRDIFGNRKSTGGEGEEGDVTVAFFENQGDRIFDLQNDRKELVLREDGAGQIQIIGLSSQKVENETELFEKIQQGNSLRATEPTQNNPHSSRSHAICEFRFGNSGGSLRIVDLAGCERRQDVSEHSIERVNEMKDINWSLGCLKECIRIRGQGGGAQVASMSAGAEVASSSGESTTEPTTTSSAPSGIFIPFRRSKLTMLLKDCFVSKEQKTVFISHISSMNSSSGHIGNTLLYTRELMAPDTSDTTKSGSLESNLQNLSASDSGAGTTSTDVSTAAKPPPPIVLPEKWSKPRFIKWLSQVDEGRYEKLVESFQITGAAMKNMPPGTSAGGLVPRVLAAGGSEEDADALGEAFRKETNRLKMMLRKAAGGAAGGKSGKGGGKK